MLFLKRLSDVFDEKREVLRKQYVHLPKERLADVLEDRNSYGDTFFVPKRARWNENWTDENGRERPSLKDTQTDIGATLNKAIGELEDENQPLHGVLKGHINFNEEVGGKSMRPAVVAPARLSYGRLVRAIACTHRGWQGRAIAAVNQALVLRNWLVGAHLVQYEQGGADRAKYGARLLERLATDLAAQGVQGLGVSILERCRLAFLAYPQLAGAIPETVRTELGRPLQIPYTLSTESQPVAPLTPERVLRFSWSKLQELVRLDDPLKRAFYENECLQGDWSVRQLRRQIETLLYERTGLSTNKRAVIARARKQGAMAPAETVEALIRDPYVLEFAGLAERAAYSENDLETALLDHLQRFLLELGTGFCFEARQFRVTVNNKHDRIDLVFYHRRLRCHVLFDLKIRAFRHMDAGQMNFYLNWFKAHMQAPGDRPPVGIILCSDKDGTEVEFATAGIDNKLFVSRYLTALPSVAQLKAFVDSDRAALESGRRRKR